MGKIFTYSKFKVLLLGTLLMASCTERIQIELDSTYTRLVVQGAVTSDSVRHRIILTTSSDYFSNMSSPQVSGAVVKISFDTQSLTLVENPFYPGLYETPVAFKGVIGTTYELDINQVDVDEDGQDEEYHAESTMRGGAELDDLALRYFSTPIVNGYQVLMWASHPVEQRDWFGFRIRKNGILLTDSLSTYSVLSDDLFNSGYLPGFPVGFLSDEDPRQRVNPGDTVTFELESIDQAYFDFINDAQLEMIGSIPLFTGPPANIRSNINNGGMGIFAAYSILRATTIHDP